MKRKSCRFILHFAGLSAVYNSILAVGKIFLSIYTNSTFLFIHGFYNIGIVLTKYIAIKGHYDEENAPHAHKRNEYRSYFMIGLVISITSVIYMVYSIKLFTHNHSNIVYTRFTATVIAAVTVIEVIVAIRGIIITRRNKELIYEAIKLTKYASSLISSSLTQVAVYSFISKGDPSIYCGITGLTFGFLSALTGVYMMIRIKRIEANNKEGSNKA